jgi:putative ABC transport system permease protein
LVLASSIGLTTGIFSILNAASFRPLDLPDAEQLAGLSGGAERGALHRRIPNALFRAMRESMAGQVELAAADLDREFRLRMQSGGDGRSVSGAVVSDNYFSVLRARAEMGGAEGDGVVISDGLWRTQFGATKAIIGTQIWLNNRPQTVVGVMPERFPGTDIRRPGLWVRESSLPLDGREERSVVVTARVASGMTLRAAEATLSALAGRLPQSVPASEAIRTIRLRPAVLFPINEEMAPFAALLLFPALLALIIACANLANLQLARAAMRGTEIATRLSLGASRGRVIRQLLTESLLLACLGGIAGTIAAWQMLTLAGNYLRTQTVNLTVPETPLDGRVLGFALAIVCLTAVVCGLAPALRASGEDLAGMTREGHGMGGPGGARIRHWLMATQLAVCTFLLFGAGMMIRSFQAATATEPGFRSQGTIVARMHLEGRGLQARAVERFRMRMGTAGGVHGVSAVSGPPLSDRPALPVFVMNGGEARYGLVSPFNRVSPEYFENLGIGVVAGRTFHASEGLVDAGVAIVSQATAQRLWPGESPIGKRFRMGTDPAATAREVIGVVRDTRSVWLSRVDESYVYLPFASSEAGAEALTLLIHLDRDTPAAREEVLRAMRAQEPDAPVELESLDEIVNRWRLLPLAGSALATALGLFGLGLAGVGMHGVMSYVVSQRTREFGIRLATVARPAGSSSGGRARSCATGRTRRTLSVADSGDDRCRLGWGTHDSLRRVAIDRRHRRRSRTGPQFTPLDPDCLAHDSSGVIARPLGEGLPCGLMHRTRPAVGASRSPDRSI